MPVASSLLHLATVIARLADSFSLARCQLRLRLGHTHLGNFHFVNTQAKLCDMCGLRTWTATGSTLVNVSVESRKCSLPPSQLPLRPPEKPPKTRHWKIAKARNKLVHKLCEMDLLAVQKVVDFVVSASSASALPLLSSSSYPALLLLLFMLGLHLALIWLICQHSHWPRACFNCDLCCDKFSLNWPQFSRILSG